VVGDGERGRARPREAAAAAAVAAATSTAVERIMIAAALVSVVLAVLPAVPARGDGPGPYVPLVHVAGWHELGPGTPDYPAYWEYAPAEQDWAFTLDAAHWVDVRAGGTCTVDGEATRRATLLRHARCYGSGGA
jgi:hypothetical protein